MRATMRLFYYLILSVFIVGKAHVADTSSWYQLSASKQSSVSRIQIPVEVFLTSTCPHCQALSAFLDEYQKTHLWVTVHRYYIDTDKNALEKLNSMAQSQHSKINPFMTPAVFFCDSRWIGFDNAEHTGKEISNRLNFCKQAIIRDGRLSAETIQKLRVWGDAAAFDMPFNYYFHGVLYPLSVAFFDSISSGVFAVVVIVAFLMLGQNSQTSFRWQSGLVAIATLIHLCQQLQISLFQDIPYVFAWLALGVGVWLLVFLWKHSKSSSPNIVSSALLGLSAVTVAMITVFQTQTIPNFSVIFEQHLSVQNMSRVGYWSALCFYQAIYGLLLLVYIYLLRRISSLFKAYPKVVQFFYKGVLVYTALYLSLTIY